MEDYRAAIENLSLDQLAKNLRALRESGMWESLKPSERNALRKEYKAAFDFLSEREKAKTKIEGLSAIEQEDAENARMAQELRKEGGILGNLTRDFLRGVATTPASAARVGGFALDRLGAKETGSNLTEYAQNVEDTANVLYPAPLPDAGMVEKIGSAAAENLVPMLATGFGTKSALQGIGRLTQAPRALNAAGIVGTGVGMSAPEILRESTTFDEYGNPQLPKNATPVIAGALTHGAIETGLGLSPVSLVTKGKGKFLTGLFAKDTLKRIATLNKRYGPGETAKIIAARIFKDTPLGDAIGEGVEEVLQSPVTILTKNLANADVKEALTKSFDEMANLGYLESLGEEFVIGTAVGGIYGGARTTIDKIDNAIESKETSLKEKQDLAKQKEQLLLESDRTRRQGPPPDVIYSPVSDDYNEMAQRPGLLEAIDRRLIEYDRTRRQDSPPDVIYAQSPEDYGAQRPGLLEAIDRRLIEYDRTRRQGPPPDVIYPPYSEGQSRKLIGTGEIPRAIETDRTQARSVPPGVINVPPTSDSRPLLELLNEMNNAKKIGDTEAVNRIIDLVNARQSQTSIPRKMERPAPQEVSQLKAIKEVEKKPEAPENEDEAYNSYLASKTKLDSGKTNASLGRTFVYEQPDGKKKTMTRRRFIESEVSNGSTVETREEYQNRTAYDETKRRVEKAFDSANENVIKRDLAIIGPNFETEEFKALAKLMSVGKWSRELRDKAIDSVTKALTPKKTTYMLGRKNERNSYFNITKAEYDYFNFLLGRKAKVETPDKQKDKKTEDKPEPQNKPRALIESEDKPEPQNKPRALIESEDKKEPAVALKTNTEIKTNKRSGKALAHSPSGRSLNVRYDAISADDLITSDMPEFPKELQPRDRTTLFSADQISKIAHSPIINKLITDYPDADTGSPIVVPYKGKYVVLSGNGRTMGMRQGYEFGTMEEYKERLNNEGREYGIQNVAENKPIFVRVLEGEHSQEELKELAIDLNREGKLAMSAGETANVDADAVRKYAHLVTSFSDITSTNNWEFLQRFFSATTVKTDLSKFISRDRGLTSDGVAKLERALFAGAYGDGRIATMFAEDPDPNVANIINGMLNAAPAVAYIDALIEQNNAYDLSISRTVAETVDELSRLRLEGKSIKHYFLQPTLPGVQQWLSKTGEDLLRIFDKFKHSGKKITDFLVGYCDVVKKLGSPIQPTFEEVVIPTRAEIMQAVIERMLGNEQPDLFSGEAGSRISFKENDGLGGQSRQAVEQSAKTEPVTTKEAKQETDAKQSAEQKPSPEQRRDNKPQTKSKQSDAGPNKEKAKIEDFGEVLEGAKKHYAAEYASLLKGDADASDVPLTQFWPVPNYEKLIQSGISKDTVSLVRAIRETLPKKPRTRYRSTSDWSYYIKLLREEATRLLSGEITVADFKGAYKKLPTAMLGLYDLYNAIGHESSLSDFNLRAFNKKGGLVYGITEGSIILSEGETKEEAIEAFKQKLPDYLARKSKKGKTPKFSVYIKTSGPDKGKAFIGVKVGTNLVELKWFDNAKEARAYLQNNTDELMEILSKYKELPDVREEANKERQGKDRRGGKDITPEDFSKAFGFRGVQFGNWVESEKRQEDLNSAYDALLDLAEIINVPPKALSLNGSLGLAFGARGSGGISPASAHYEPAKVVINLTKKKGAGSLAHEWFHALDNYFGKRAERNASEGMIDYGEREVVKRAFADLMNTLMKTELPRRSSEMDKRRSSPYWSTRLEMIARAFESYVIHKLENQAYSNDYLANIKREYQFDAIGLANMYPYLKKSEIAAVVDAFDNLFNTLKTEETEKGIRLYSAEYLVAKYAAKGIKQAKKVIQRGFEIMSQGVRDLAGWAKQMLREFGQNIKDYIRGLYKDLGAAFKERGLHNRRGAISYKDIKRETKRPLKSKDFKREKIDNIYSQSFKRWFGDWQKEPKNASKITNEDGTPKIVYHGTDSVFTTFDITKGRANSDIQGFYFNPSKIEAGDYGKNVGAFYLSIKNPATPRVAYKAFRELKGQNNAGIDAREYLISLGYDGIDYDGEEYVAFYREQIKSATDNIGTYDPKNPDTRFSAMGEPISSTNQETTKRLIDRLKKSGLEVITNQKEFTNNISGRPDRENQYIKPDGTVYGYVRGGKIYLNPDEFTADTVVHEYTHLWGDAIRSKYPKVWQNIVNLMKGTPIWDEVKKSRSRIDINDNNDIADEVLATYSGRQGAERLNELSRTLGSRIIDRIRNAITRFWQQVREFFGFDKYKTAEEVANAALSDLLSGYRPTSDEKKTRFSVKDIQKLTYKFGDMDISMKTFTDVFQSAIKAKDRTIEDAERIANDYINSAKENASALFPKVTGETLKYEQYLIMPDGTTYDPNKAEHADASDITRQVYFAKERGSLPQLLHQEAEEINKKRKADLTQLIRYFQDNTDYAAVEKAIIIQLASKYGIGIRRKGDQVAVDLITISNSNRVEVPVVDGVMASHVVSALREGMSSRKALQKAALESVKSAAGKRGVPANYTGWKSFKKSNKDKDAIALNNAVKGCSGGWCTGGAVSTARSHLSGGDFHVWFNRGEPAIAIRTNNGQLAEPPRGSLEGQGMTEEEEIVAERFLRGNNGVTGGEEYLADRDDIQKFKSGKMTLKDAFLLPRERRVDNGEFGGNLRAWPKPMEEEVKRLLDDPERLSKGYYFAGEERDNASEVIYFANKSDTTYQITGSGDFPKLEHITGPTELFGSAHFPNLKTTSDYTFIYANVNAPNLASIGGSAGIREGAQVPNLVSISRNAFIQQGAQVPKLETVGGEANIYENAQVPNLVSIGKDAFISEGVQVPSLKTVGQGATIRAGAQVPNLVSIGGSGHISEGVQAPKLEAIGAFADIRKNVQVPSLETIGGDASIYMGSTVPKLKTIGGGVSIYVGTKAPNLVSIGGYAFIQHGGQVPKLETIGGEANIASGAQVPNLKSVGGGAYIREAAQLPKLETIRGFAHISDGAQVPNLVSIGAEAKISEGVHIPKLETIGDNAEIEENVQLPALKTIGRYAHISKGVQVPNLVSIKGRAEILKGVQATNLETIGRKAEIHVGVQVPKLKTIGGEAIIHAGVEVPNLETIGEGAYIHNNVKASNLVSIGGSAHILEGVQVPKLETIGGTASIHEGVEVPNLETVGEGAIINDGAKVPKLKTIGGAGTIRGGAQVPKLETIGGEAIIRAGAQAPSLVSIGGDAYIYKDAYLPNLETIGGEAHIAKGAQVPNLKSVGGKPFNSEQPLYSAEYLAAKYAAKGLRQAARVIERGVTLIQDGIEKFAQWARQMFNEFGQNVKKYLKELHKELSTAFSQQKLHSRRGAINIGSGKKTEFPGGRFKKGKKPSTEKQQAAKAKREEIAKEYIREGKERIRKEQEEAARAKTTEGRIKRFIKSAEEVLFDSWAPARRLQEDVEKKTGKPISDDLNLYTKLELLSSKIVKNANKTKSKYMDKIKKALVQNKIEVKDMNYFLYLMHAEERNKAVASREGSPFAITGEPGSGISDEDAMRELKKYQAKPNYQAYLDIANMTYELNDFLLDEQVRLGVMSEKQRNNYRKYKHYTPLKSPPDQGLILDKDALGRRSLATDQLAYIEQAISAVYQQGFKRDVINTAIELFKLLPDNSMYERIVPKKVQRLTKKGKIIIRQEMEQFYGKPDIIWSSDTASDTNTVYRIKNESLRKALKSSFDGDSVEKSLFRFFATINRWYSAAATSLNPEFIYTNLMRDVQQAFAGLKVLFPEDLSTKFLSNLNRSRKAISDAKNKIETADTKLLEEFTLAGGSVGYSEFTKIEKRAHQMEKEVSDAIKGGTLYEAKQAIKKMFGFIDEWNGAIETRTRLATFITAKEAGYSTQKAAAIAKNITVNFNKKGTWGPALNSLFIFTTANLGGNMVTAKVIMRAAKTPKGKAMIAAAIGLGFLSEIVNSLIVGDDDEDGVNYYDKVPSYIKDANYVLMIPNGGGKYVSIPMPYGLNVLPTIGRNMAATMFGRQSATDGALNIVGSVLDSFNPLGGDRRGLLHQVVPTAVRPFVDVATNTDWTNKKISPENYNQLARSELHFKDTSKVIRDISQFLNTISGGDRYASGFLDYLTPAEIEHLITQHAGGVGAFMARSLDVLTKDTRELTFNRIPVARRFVNRTGDYHTFNAFWENDRLVNDFDMAKRERNIEWLKKNRWLSQLSEKMKRTKRIMAAIDKSSRDDFEKRERTLKIQKEFNREFDRIKAKALSK